MFSEYMLITLFYTSGVLMSSKISMSMALFIPASLVVVFLVRKLVSGKSSVAVLAAALCFLLGSVRYYGATQNQLFYELPDKYVTLFGTVVSLPTEGNGEYKYRYTVKADSITYLDNTYITDKKILVNTRQKLAYGDKIKATGFLGEIEGPDNTNEYDYARYYKSIGVYNRITARELEKTGVEKSFNPVFLAGRIRYNISELIDRFFQGNKAALYKAIIIGDRTGLEEDFRLLLIRTGMSRTLYSAYLHISLILLVAGVLMRSKKRADKDFAVMVLLILYALANSSAATILKAAALLWVVIFRKAVRGFADKLDVLSLVVFVMTLADPMLCYSSGFVISVSSTIVVYTSYPAVYSRLMPLYTRNVIKSKIKKITAMWIVLLLGTLPFVAYFYNGTSVYGILLTYLLAPVMMFLLIISPLVLGMYAAFGTAPVLGWVVSSILGVLEKLPYLVEKLPFCYVTMRTPDLLGFVIFYVIWWIGIRVISGRLKTNKTKLLLVVLCGLLTGSISEYSFDTLSVYFVNVGQGDGAILKTTAGETVLIDGGGAAVYETDYNIGESVYVPYLISHGLTDIDVAIVTHYHKDHIEGIIAAAKRFKIGTIVMPDASPGNEYRKELEAIAYKRNINLEYLMENDEINFRSGLRIKFIAPDKEQLLSDEPNDTSLVAQVEYGKFCALFTGDSTDEIDENYPKDIDILKVAHHGSDTSSGKEYINYLSPEYAVISVGRDNSYGLPKDDVLKRLKESGARVFRTDESGDICFKVRKNGKVTYSSLKGG